MSKTSDQALLEAVKTHRQRLRAAFLGGSLGARRETSMLLGRFFVGIVLAAVACAACAGVSFVTTTLRQQAELQLQQEQQRNGVPADQTPETPTPAPADIPAEPPLDVPIDSPAETPEGAPAEPPSDTAQTPPDDTTSVPPASKEPTP